MLKLIAGFRASVSPVAVPSRVTICTYLSNEAKNYLRREIAKFDPKIGVAKAKTPPPSWYIAPEFYQLDKAAIFRSNYTAVESLHRVHEKDAFTTAAICGDQYLLTKPGDFVKGFYNICTHHAVTLEWSECGKKSRFECPYHSWVFDNEGRLTKTLKMKGIECFKPKDYGLVPLDVTECWPIAFVKPTKHPTAPGSSKANMELLKKYLSDGQNGFFLTPDHLLKPENYEHVIRKVYDFKCNWKIYIDNFLDDSYHFKPVHGKTQGTIVDFDKFRTDVLTTDKSSGELYEMAILSAGYTTAPEAGFSVKFYHVYPNVIIQMYKGRHFLDIYYVLPTGPETIKLISDWFAKKSYLNSGASNDEIQAHIKANFEFENETHIEDLIVCERQQEGIRSWGFEYGRYVPQMEHAMYSFHQRLTSEYLRYLDSDME